MLRILGMYFKLAICLTVLPFLSCSGMAEPILAQDTNIRDHVSIAMSKDLFYFFAPKLCSLKSVRQTTYDEQTEKAICALKYKRNTYGLLNDQSLICFLNSNTMPNEKQENQINLVLAAFVKLAQLLDTNFIMFNKPKTGVILNPMFAQIQDPDMRTVFKGIEQSARICAKFAGIPFLK